ncbi:hypothetical protein [Dyella mobilis]|uniref:Uncharacterized protein n=1 Tax=Dyella mobilis TaxID=1849582 RepID=A0ABS2KKU8_9GAMM|nr:hypothetical protein [Dyella mobilis]MBM7131790.1 hypothetical protein [Dyella mobilis]GLQ96231.1 hypothetical protein GCM10007863_06490 [Dyella mobilis]
MSHFKPNSKFSNNQVDWSDPRLDSLLRKTEGWTLDNRGGFAATPVQIHVGWGANSVRHAVLVWENDQVMVLETRFLIPQGEHVRVDRAFGQTVRTVWGVVAEGREGFREDDRLNGVYVHWLHAC